MRACGWKRKHFQCCCASKQSANMKTKYGLLRRSMVPALRTCDSVCVLLFSSAWLCVFNLYLVFAIIAFSCNWHIECVCVCVSVWNARARENNSRFVRWRAAHAVGWVRAHARRAWERTHSRVCREWWARKISVSVCGYLDRACVRDFCLLSFHYAIVLSHASRRARFLTCLNR